MATGFELRKTRLTRVKYFAMTYFNTKTIKFPDLIFSKSKFKTFPHRKHSKEMISTSENTLKNCHHIFN